MGPVPASFDSLYEFLVNSCEIRKEYKWFDNGSYGEQFFPASGRQFDASIFEAGEVETLHYVLKTYGPIKSKDIINLSHKELGWLECHEGHQLISYRKYGFELRDLTNNK
jgi:hypothetical protein